MFEDEAMFRALQAAAAAVAGARAPVTAGHLVLALSAYGGDGEGMVEEVAAAAVALAEA